MKYKSIAVCGLGYVGLPLATAFAESGSLVFGYDPDETKIQKIYQGESYVEAVSNERLSSVVNQYKLKASNKKELLAGCSAFLICVPTPVDEYEKPNLKFIEAAITDISDAVKIQSRNPDQKPLVILESTTYPGTTRECVSKGLAPLEPGKDYFLAYSPEREDPGNQVFQTKNTPRVVGGFDQESWQEATELYRRIIDNLVPVSSLETAEATKILENSFRALNIGFINELKITFDKMNIDIWEVIEAASSKPFGFMPFYPSARVGGHCIPCDPYYLLYRAKKHGAQLPTLASAMAANDAVTKFVFEKIVKALNKVGKALLNSRIVLLGASYKKNVGDIRDSAALTLIPMLLNQGAIVNVLDPHLESVEAEGVTFDCAYSKDCEFQQYDAVILLTDHDEFDYEKLHEQAKILVDTRNKFPKGPKVVKA